MSLSKDSKKGATENHIDKYRAGDITDQAPRKRIPDAGSNGMYSSTFSTQVPEYLTAQSMKFISTIDVASVEYSWTHHSDPVLKTEYPARMVALVLLASLFNTGSHVKPEK